MELVRTVPRLGAPPEIFGFYCAPCKTIEVLGHSSRRHCCDPKGGYIRKELATRMKESPERVPELQGPEESSSGTRHTNDTSTREVRNQK
jgi:hypothetical protein